MFSSAMTRIVLIVFLWLAFIAGGVLWFSDRDVTRISIAAGPATGESFELAMAIADVLESKNSSYQVDVYETQGSAENATLLSSGQVDFGTVQADANVDSQVALVANLYADAFQLVATTESGIESVANLAGKRIAIPPTGSGQNASFWFLIDHYGLTPDRLTALPMSDAAANFAMHSGQVDAVFRVRAPGNKLVRELVSDQQNMRLVAIDQPAALALVQPMIRSGVIPKGSYRGYPPLPVTDLQTAVVNRVLVANAELDEALVYDVTRLLFEQRSALTLRSTLAGFIQPIADSALITIPLHDGARSYYDREKPTVLQQNSRLAATLLYACALLGSVLVALRSRFQNARRVRVGDYNRELMEIATSARSATIAADLAGGQKRIVDLLGQMIEDLDADKVTKDEFDHFSFTWRAVESLLRERALQLAMAPTASNASAGSQL